MAHELHTTDRMVSFGGIRPWHADETTLDGRCVVVPGYPASFRSALHVAGADWTPEAVALRTDDGETVPGFVALRRSDTHHKLGVVTDSYAPLSNAQACSALEPVLRASGGKIETVGTVKDSSVFFASVNLGIAHQIVPGDEVRTYAMVSSGHNGARGWRCTITSVRPVCWNTITLGEASGQLLADARHTSGIYNAVDNARNGLASIVERANRAADEMKSLAARRVATDDVLDILGAVFPLAESATDRQRKNNREIVSEVLELCEIGKGADIPGVRGTAWGLLNAVTEWEDRKRASDSAWDELTFAAQFGPGADAKSRAFETVKAWVAAHPAA